jgi:serine protease Do
MRKSILPTAIVALVGAIIGSFAMMLYASTHFAGVAGPDNTPPQLSAAALTTGSDQERIVGAVKRVAPSVVALNVTVNGQQMVPSDPVAQMFGMQSPGRLQRYHARASGSGFVYSRDGLIITNAHVVHPPNGASVTRIEVVFQNNERVPGHVVAANLAADLALVKVDGYAKLPPPIEIADSNKLQAGQWAIAIGEPFELKQSVALGVVSGFNRDETIGTETGAQEFKGLLQISTPINPGNSGGPLIDIDGRLIGVNQSTANPQAGAQGIGFAIPSNTVREQVALLEKNPGTHQGTNVGYIGASLATITPDLRVQLNYPQGSGVAIMQVVSGTPADAAALQPGDVIQRVNGKDVTKSEDAIAAIKAVRPGATVALQVWSSGVRKLVNVKVTERPADVPVPQQQPLCPGRILPARVGLEASRVMKPRGPLRVFCKENHPAPGSVGAFHARQ